MRAVRFGLVFPVWPGVIVGVFARLANVRLAAEAKGIFGALRSAEVAAMPAHEDGGHACSTSKPVRYGRRLRPLENRATSVPSAWCSAVLSRSITRAASLSGNG